jgi:Domain of unknown function (DUF4112)
MQKRLDRLRRWSTLLDDAFEVPGTGLRVGWDPIVGLLPGIGDLLTPLYSVLIITTAVRLGVPRVVQMRMVFNVLIDAVIGSVPIVGDLFDAAWKANAWNMQLLDRHAWTMQPASPADWVFVAAVIGLLAAAVLVPVVVFVWLIYAVGRPLV